MGGRPGYIFEIFQNGHIFLKFYFFLNIKKKKPHGLVGETTGPQPTDSWGPGLDLSINRPLFATVTFFVFLQMLTAVS